MIFYSTAVLFTRKAQAALKRPEIIMKEESSCDTLSMDKVKSPKRIQKIKRFSNRRSIDGGNGSISDLQDFRKSPSTSPTKSPHHHKEPPYESIPDSFRVYRANTNREISESEVSDLSDLSGSRCSSCSRYSGSGTESDMYTSTDDGASISGSEMILSNSEMDYEEIMEHDELDKLSSKLPSSSSASLNTRLSIPPQSSSSLPPPTPPPSFSSQIQNNIEQQKHQQQQQQQLEKPSLEPLQLVWAKCRGYPWYPALIIDPKIPKNFIYNGVPLPAPPQDVLNLRKNYTEEVYLVLFFDVKRTWQWLPSNKLELLGLDKSLDQAKLIESRKPQERKAVKKAYQDALHYQNQVSEIDDGENPGPIM